MVEVVEGVGAVIVVGDGERPSHTRTSGIVRVRRRTARIGEELECAKPMVNPKEHSVDVWMIFVRHKRVSPERNIG